MSLDIRSNNKQTDTQLDAHKAVDDSVAATAAARESFAETALRLGGKSADEVANVDNCPIAEQTPKRDLAARQGHHDQVIAREQFCAGDNHQDQAEAERQSCQQFHDAKR